MPATNTTMTTTTAVVRVLLDTERISSHRDVDALGCGHRVERRGVVRLFGPLDAERRYERERSQRGHRGTEPAGQNLGDAGLRFRRNARANASGNARGHHVIRLETEWTRVGAKAFQE